VCVLRISCVLFAHLWSIAPICALHTASNFQGQQMGQQIYQQNMSPMGQQMGGQGVTKPRDSEQTLVDIRKVANKVYTDMV